MNIENPVASALNGGGSTLRISGLTATDGYVLTVQADGTLATEAAAASGVGGSTGATDNALLRADGTGGATVQSSGITVADAASGVAEMTSARLVRGQRVISSSPDTQLVSDDTLYFSAALTVDLLTSVTTGREFLYVCTAAATLTLDPGGTDTIDGGGAGVALAIPCAAGQAVRLIRSGSGAWRSVQAGPLTVNAIYAYFASGTAYAQSANIAPNGTITPIGSAVAATAADPTPLGVAGSGANIAFPAAITSPASTVGATATRWTWALADLGITLPSGPLQTVYNVVTSSMSEGTRGAVSEYVLWGLGTSATAPTSLVGISRPTSGTAWSYAYLVSTSASSVTGAATLTRVSGVRVVGDSTNTDYTMWQYAGSDMTGSASGVSGPSVTTTPTHVGIYGMVSTGTSVGTWTLTAPIFTLRWNVL